MSKEELQQKLADAVVNLEKASARAAAEEALAAGLSPFEAVTGLSNGMKRIGDLWNAMELFLPEVLAASDAYYAGMAVIRPSIDAQGDRDFLATLVFGTIYGDIHTVGKDVVVPVFQAAGYNVIDLGVDVPAEKYIEAVKQYGAVGVGLGTYMSETFLHAGEVIKALEEAGVRDKVVVVCGGPAADDGAARRMGADGGYSDAWKAVHKVTDMLKERGWLKQ